MAPAPCRHVWVIYDDRSYRALAPVARFKGPPNRCQGLAKSTLQQCERRMSEKRQNILPRYEGKGLVVVREGDGRPELMLHLCFQHTDQANFQPLREKSNPTKAFVRVHESSQGQLNETVGRRALGSKPTNTQIKIRDQGINDKPLVVVAKSRSPTIISEIQEPNIACIPVGRHVAAQKKLSVFRDPPQSDETQSSSPASTELACTQKSVKPVAEDVTPTRLDPTITQTVLAITALYNSAQHEVEALKSELEKSKAFIKQMRIETRDLGAGARNFAKPEVIVVEAATQTLDTLDRDQKLGDGPYRLQLKSEPLIKQERDSAQEPLEVRSRPSMVASACESQERWSKEERDQVIWFKNLGRLVCGSSCSSTCNDR